METSPLLVNERAMMEWQDVNDIIDDLVDVLLDIEENHSELGAFKAPIARAIATMRAERMLAVRSPGALAVMLGSRPHSVSRVMDECVYRDLASLF